MPIARVRHNEATFTSAGFEPVLPANGAPVGAAGDADIRVVLLRAINVVGKRIVHGNVVKLRSRLVVLSGPILATVGRNACTAIAHIGDSVWVRWVNP